MKSAHQKFNSFPNRAALYARKSTKAQHYSIENQIIGITEYAISHNLEIVDTFIDNGISGLTFERRPSLKRLMEIINTGAATFGNILVFDVSRWGRFQDIDESAYYEYMCRKAGIKVHYIAEQFENDGTSISTVLKAMKRIMAAEYSRELSAKVFNAKARMAKQGFHQGGIRLYGFNRVLIGIDGKEKQILGPTERKSIQSERVKLALGPKQEQRIVRWIYKKFTEDNFGDAAIARTLNKRGVKSHTGRSWTRDMVEKILKNEIYMGKVFFNKTSLKLGTAKIKNPREQWIEAEDRIPPIVKPAVFEKAQLKRRHQLRDL